MSKTRYRTPINPFRIDLGANIRDRLNHKDKTAGKLAVFLGVTPSTVSRILNGLHSTSAEQLAKIAAFLDCSANALLRPRKKTENRD